MYNANLLLNGYAEQSTYAPDVKYAEYFKNYAAEARNASKGLWVIDPNGTTKGDTDKAVSNSSVSTNSNSSSANNSSGESSSASSSSSGFKPAQSNVNQSGGEFIITATGKKYHRSGCRTIKQVKATVSREEAESMGYGPCGVCHP